MKRTGNIYTTVYSMENIAAADVLAQAHKSKQPAVIRHNKHREQNLTTIHATLKNKNYAISHYHNFTINDPKERTISSLPFKDRIVQHAIMRPIENVFVSVFTKNTYSNIKGRGTHKACNDLIKALKDVNGTTYCLKLDIQKFYPSIDHETLKSLLRKKFKDNDLLQTLDGIINSAPGLPIGNYLSQYLSNFYLAFFDHWLKEVKKVKYYFRYCDDTVFLSNDKAYLHELLANIKKYLGVNLKLTVKKNYQVFPVAARGIDFLGYVFYHTHIRLRKRIKKNMLRMLAYYPNAASLASYKGYAKHCNSKNLLKTISINA